MTISESKGIGTAFIAIAGSIGAALPLFFKQLGNHNLRLARAMGFIQRCFTAIGAGVVLATGFVHIMPDGIEAVEDAGWNMEAYPYGYLIALCGVVAFYLMEAEMHNFVSEAQGPTAKIHIVEAGIAVHSILVGVAFGTEEDDQTAKVLSIALCFHQMCEGLAMGPLIRRGMKSLPHGLLLVMIFALSAPIGIMIGWLVYVFSDPDQAYSQAIQGVFDLIAAGLLIYVGCAEFLGELVHSPLEEEGPHSVEESSVGHHHHHHDDGPPLDLDSASGSEGNVQDTPDHQSEICQEPTQHSDASSSSRGSLASRSLASRTDSGRRYSYTQRMNSSFVDTWVAGDDAAIGETSADETKREADLSKPLEPTPIEPQEQAPLVLSQNLSSDDFITHHPTMARLIIHGLVVGGAAVMSTLAIWS